MSADRSIPDLLNDVLQHVTGLIRKEFDLLRTELGEKASAAAVSAGMVAGGLVIALVALILLAAAVVAALAEAGLGAGWSALIVGLVLAIVAFVLAQRGIAGLKATNLAPRRTAESLEKDAAAIREAM